MNLTTQETILRCHCHEKKVLPVLLSHLEGRQLLLSNDNNELESNENSSIHALHSGKKTF